MTGGLRRKEITRPGPIKHIALSKVLKRAVTPSFEQNFRAVIVDHLSWHHSQ